jgi:hypothetical protein
MAAPAAAQPSTNTSQTNIPIPQARPALPQHQQQRQPLTDLRQLAALSPPTSNPASVSSASASPSKASLTNWWKGFKSKPLFRKGDEQDVAPKGISPTASMHSCCWNFLRHQILIVITGIFGVSLTTSIEYAYVNISITNPHGDSEVYGRIPIIVAKCGVYLKDKGSMASRRC